MSENDNDKVFKLRGLDPDREGQYLLTLYYPMPFQTGHRIFLIDRLAMNTDNYQAHRGEDLIVQFPKNFNFLLVNRSEYESITMAEAKKLMEKSKDEDEEGELNSEETARHGGWL